MWQTYPNVYKSPMRLWTRVLDASYWRSAKAEEISRVYDIHFHYLSALTHEEISEPIHNPLHLPQMYPD